MKTAVAGIIVLGVLLGQSGCTGNGEGKASKGKDSGKAESAGHKEAEGQERLTLSEDESRQAGLKVERVQAREVRDHLVLTANIQMNQDKLAHIEPRVAGRIVKVTANLGDRVKAGQTLAILDSLEVGEAHSAYLQAESELALATSALERAETLKADDIIPQKDYLRTRAEHEKARVSLRAAADKLRMLDVTPAKSQGAVSVFPLNSPFAGTVVEKDAVLGELAEPNKVVFTVADLSVLWIEADVPEIELKNLRLGMSAEIVVAAYPADRFKGRITYVGSQMNRETRTVKARIEVPNPRQRLKPQMFATAAIEGGASQKALLVPGEAVVLMQGQPHVFVAREGGYEPRPVELGGELKGMTALKRGVEPGESVVVSGAYALKAKLLKSQISDTH